MLLTNGIDSKVMLLKTNLISHKTRNHFLHGRNINKSGRQKDEQLLAVSAGCWLDWRLSDDESKHKHSQIIHTLISRSQRKIKVGWYQFDKCRLHLQQTVSESFRALQRRGPRHQPSLITDSERHTQTATHRWVLKVGVSGAHADKEKWGGQGGKAEQRSCKKATGVGFEWVSKMKLPELHVYFANMWLWETWELLKTLRLQQRLSLMHIQAHITFTMAMSFISPANWKAVISLELCFSKQIGRSSFILSCLLGKSLHHSCQSLFSAALVTADSIRSERKWQIPIHFVWIGWEYLKVHSFVGLVCFPAALWELIKNGISPNVSVNDCILWPLPLFHLSNNPRAFTLLER